MFLNMSFHFCLCVLFYMLLVVASVCAVQVGSVHYLLCAVVVTQPCQRLGNEIEMSSSLFTPITITVPVLVAEAAR